MKHFFLFLLFFFIFAFTSLAQKEKQHGLLVFGEIRKDFYEDTYTQGGITKADTFPLKEISSTSTYRYFYLPDIRYVSLKGKRLTNFAILGGWQKSIYESIVNGITVPKKVDVTFNIQTSYSEAYNYLSLLKGKLKAHIGGIFQVEINKSSQYIGTQFGLLAYTNLVYLHKKHYWLELGLPKKVLSFEHFNKPLQGYSPFQNDFKKPFLPIKIGVGFIF